MGKDTRSATSSAAFAVETRCRRFEGRVAIVTGAAQGLGRVIARRLSEEGADVVVCDINQDKICLTKESLAAETGGKFLALGGDLSKNGVADGIVSDTITEFGRVDILVNNAAALIRHKLVDFSEDLMQLAVDANVWTTLRMCKAALPPMTGNGFGRIVNIGGEAWRTGTPYHTLLGGIGKGSMVGLTATLAGETARDGITVNCVSPGAMDSAADGSATSAPVGRDPGWTPPEVLSALSKESGIRMGRIAHPTEVAAVVAFFVSPEASYITGQHVGVSGGMAMI